ncbi:NifU family protein [Vulgatibacter sp.]|uniref:NifU family protein n=1 Tax=Vulgatibacter sp. TaxID=1971226 RepID=UPI00356526E6
MVQVPGGGAGADPRDGERIEELLEQLAAGAAPQTWVQVEELVRRLVSVYGTALGQLLAHARAAGADGVRLADALCADEPVSSLLLLHGLHPLPIGIRITEALDRVRPQLGLHEGGVELVAIDENHAVTLRLTGSCDGCASSQATLEQSIRAALEAAAPEITRIELEGARASLPVVP